ncbi:hypothetical protein [Halomonas elongata]|uniref:Uncharacterized protein n=1 Tax=Halomonas elongata (strain ATCC 33173 / DSM 2581 / NBRC 15536 / NCIMB 2198 / 1H9) TaxID=768066 RepID=E1VBP1_HALED|nr:hypothetical protein [Halomonas elongata]MBW5800180.1 hypothetical protein [Halomonas elongata]MDL4863459.1 hypothetical protein [Halomonas elongata]WBF17966.1 hypothetical protein LM502_18165 [Halomonas elongata]WPU46814.1 hypothetical protein SR933_16415 [Halomonas elongata DSM 2581]WVI71532.1 hypothetical protein VO226_16705 [Halomonas elongata]
MSPSAIVVMIASIIALWGVAGGALIVSMRREERKLALLHSQGDFEPYSPRAFRDLERWLTQHPDSEHAPEIREWQQAQRQSLQHNPQCFYDWSSATDTREAP